MKYANFEILQNEHLAISNSFFLISFKVNSGGDLHFLRNFHLRTVTIIGSIHIGHTGQGFIKKIKKGSNNHAKKNFLSLYMRFSNLHENGKSL